jgi:hypothetical protein
MAAREVGDGQGIATVAVCEHDLALVVGAPQVIGMLGRRERHAGGFVALLLAVACVTCVEFSTLFLIFDA